MGAKANDVNFDSTLAAAYRMLTKQSLKVKILLDSIESDTAYFRFQITNKAGHKFPSGYPSRRAVVQFVVLNSNADTVFESGVFDGDYEVKNIDPVFEKSQVHAHIQLFGCFPSKIVISQCYHACTWCHCRSKYCAAVQVQRAATQLPRR